jgi:hypothetical protein
MGIMIDCETHPRVTPIADFIENDDSLMPGPLMGFQVKRTVHSPSLLRNGQVTPFSMDRNQACQMKEAGALYFVDSALSPAVKDNDMQRWVGKPIRSIEEQLRQGSE